jgi:ribosomal protein S18 acetylase RimI-like enzyme
MKKQVYTLEINEPVTHKAQQVASPVEIVRSGIVNPAINAFFYKEIGSTHSWYDRAEFSREQWRTYLTERKILTRLIMHSGTLAGYYELAPDEHGGIEIALFGVLRDFQGLGLGSYALAEAINEGLQLSAISRVWVSTCSLDHASALHTYQRMGMRVVSVTEE